METINSRTMSLEVVKEGGGAMKAKVFVEYGGKRYRLTKGWACDSKRMCSLFQHGVCDADNGGLELPCRAIEEAFHDITGRYHNGGFKEVK